MGAPHGDTPWGTPHWRTPFREIPLGDLRQGTHLRWPPLGNSPSANPLWVQQLRNHFVRPPFGERPLSDPPRGTTLVETLWAHISAPSLGTFWSTHTWGSTWCPLSGLHRGTDTGWPLLKIHIGNPLLSQGCGLPFGDPALAILLLHPHGVHGCGTTFEDTLVGTQYGTHFGDHPGDHVWRLHLTKNPKGNPLGNPPSGTPFGDNSLPTCLGGPPWRIRLIWTQLAETVGEPACGTCWRNPLWKPHFWGPNGGSPCWSWRGRPPLQNDPWNPLGNRLRDSIWGPPLRDSVGVQLRRPPLRYSN
jgi:hypothetical protein